MNKFLLTASLLLAGCTTVADLRESAPFIQASTDKTVQAFTACLADQWAARSGTINTAPRPQGTSMTLTYTIYSSAVPAVTVDVDDAGSNRTVRAYARSGDANDKLRRELNACL